MNQLKTIQFPFKLSVEPMQRLVVMDFTDDKEYNAMEPQYFDDPINGKGLRVLRSRKDKKVDVYFQPGVRVDKESFTLGAGLGDFIETEFERSTFEVTDEGLQVDIAFKDLSGRRVVLQVAEKEHAKGGYAFLAPVGSGVEKPLKLFLVQMLGFDFVYRHKTSINIRIGQRAVKPATLPILLKSHRVFFMRYAAMPVIASINPPMARPTVLEALPSSTVEIDGMSVHLDENSNISLLTAGEGLQKAEITFSPSYPNLVDFHDPHSVQGRWSVSLAGFKATGGTYEITRSGDEILVNLCPTERWNPPKMPFSFKFLTSIIPVFRKWPTTYRWTGKVQDQNLVGAWERI